MTRLLLLCLAIVGCTSAPDAGPDSSTLAYAPTAPRPVRTVAFPPLSGVVGAGWAPDFSLWSGMSGGCMRSLQAGRFAIPLTLAEGDRMLSISVAAIGDDSADLDINSMSLAASGDQTLGTVGSVYIEDVPSSWTDYAIDLLDTTIAAGEYYWFEFGADQSGLCVGALRLTYEVAP